LACVGIIILILYHFGLLSFYHPNKRAKDNQIRVACVGDSITYGCMVGNWRKNNYPTLLGNLLGENYCVNNFGYTNRTAIKSADYPLVNEKVYRQSLDFEPNVVVLLLGTNDSKENNWDKSVFLVDYAEIIKSYLSLKSSPKVYAIVPTPVFELGNKVLYKLRKDVIEDEVCPCVRYVAETTGVECIDILNKYFADKKELFADGVHPNAKGSRIFAEKIAEIIMSFRPKRSEVEKS
ncbi:MAG: hypothetical protein K2L70_04905, partial [Clostridia bacterium]|nr:hypothetical protein [Clostridia bacterium]